MSVNALPCLVCGAELVNVMADAENQPDGATAFETYGHYGSTAFDPMDGTALEINVCDACLVQRADRVLWNRKYRPLTCEGVIVGREWVHRSSVPWNPNVQDRETPDDRVEVSLDEVGTNRLGSRVEWCANWQQVVASIRKSLSP